MKVMIVFTLKANSFIDFKVWLLQNQVNFECDTLNLQVGFQTLVRFVE